MLCQGLDKEVFFLMYITDITKEVTASIKLFVDEAKVKKKIETEEDVENFQENLDKLYEWEDMKKMKFNGSKFKVLRYGPNAEINENTVYFTSSMEDIIERGTSLRDLGIILSDDGKFQDDIEKVVSKVRQRVGWLFRTFYTRRADSMKHLWKTLVQCDIDYCSQLYKPSQIQDMKIRD